MDNHSINTLITRSEAITAQLNKALADGADSVVLPEGYHVECLEAYKPQRLYPRGEYHTSHWQDFLAYGKARQSEGAVCFIDPDNITARIIFDYHDGRGHARNTAFCSAENTPLYGALTEKTNVELRQRDLIELLESWGDAITACNKDGETLATTQAIAILTTLTVEKARRITQTQEDFHHERTASEKAQLKAEGSMVAELRIKDVLFQGTGEIIEARYRLTLVTDGDSFSFKLRPVGYDANLRAKVEEIMKTAKAVLGMPIYIGEYNAR